MVQQWYFQFQITPVFIVRVCFTQAPPCPAEPVKLSLARHSRRKPGNQVCVPFFLLTPDLVTPRANTAI